MSGNGNPKNQTLNHYVLMMEGLVLMSLCFVVCFINRHRLNVLNVQMYFLDIIKGTNASLSFDIPKTVHTCFLLNLLLSIKGRRLRSTPHLRAHSTQRRNRINLTADLLTFVAGSRCHIAPTNGILAADESFVFLFHWWDQPKY